MKPGRYRVFKRREESPTEKVGRKLHGGPQSLWSWD